MGDDGRFAGFAGLGSDGNGFVESHVSQGPRDVGHPALAHGEQQIPFGFAQGRLSCLASLARRNDKK